MHRTEDLSPLMRQISGLLDVKRISRSVVPSFIWKFMMERRFAKFFHSLVSWLRIYLMNLDCKFLPGIHRLGGIRANKARTVVIAVPFGNQIWNKTSWSLQQCQQSELFSLANLQRNVRSFSPNTVQVWADNRLVVLSKNWWFVSFSSSKFIVWICLHSQ